MSDCAGRINLSHNELFLILLKSSRGGARQIGTGKTVAFDFRSETGLTERIKLFHPLPLLRNMSRMKQIWRDEMLVIQATGENRNRAAKERKKEKTHHSMLVKSTKTFQIQAFPIGVQYKENRLIVQEQKRDEIIP